MTDTPATRATAPSEILQQLVDERDIVATALRYTWALDGREWDRLDDVFVDDATVVFLGAPILKGRDAIKERIARSLSQFDGSQHIVGNHEVRLCDDTAKHRCYLHAQHVQKVDGDTNLFVIAGRYEDDMVRTADGWRITHRELIEMWTDGNLIKASST